ncbi:Multidrug resistance protein MdtA [Pseudoalteromonas holothuriae]|uniref:Multidrug resistance protein MdtA n=1 Tax=Pseudoalteromonas holothuriae TaxID=2963714 RepID=A0A9W4QYW5_9GAMM|nr:MULTISPECIES: efflux RND transporter periplasmic adaptor subunit [unclassified Pseudoalteromonas]CAH9060203.1 Multidrug resistance protein MdtA [Pseudoalteromonas sp. CIP111854]CAH9063394.1 Multidrug resistance protein MdtA [Pseudoalteromonas sp. CIP111951]
MRRVVVIMLAMLLGQSAVAETIVDTLPVTSNDRGIEFKMLGKVASYDEITLAGYINAHLESVKKPGTTVKAGDVVAKLDTQFLEIERALAQVEVSKAKDQIAYLNKKLNRSKALKVTNSISEEMLETLQQELSVAKSALARAQLTLQDLDLKLKKAVMVTDVDAVVSERYINRGDYVSVGTKIVKLIPFNGVELIAQLPIEYNSEFAPGMPIDIESHLGRYTVKVARVLEVANSDTQSIQVYITPSTALANKLVMGSQISLTASLVGKGTFSVPLDAVIPEKNGAYVFKLGTNNTVEKTLINVLASKEDRYIVTGEVAPGDELVTRGMRSLRDGDSVIKRVVREQ